MTNAESWYYVNPARMATEASSSNDARVYIEELIERAEEHGFKVESVEYVRSCVIVTVSRGEDELQGIGDDVIQAMAHIVAKLDTPGKEEASELVHERFPHPASMTLGVSWWRLVAKTLRARFLKWLNRCHGRRSR